MLFFVVLPSLLVVFFLSEKTLFFILRKISLTFCCFAFQILALANANNFFLSKRKNTKKTLLCSRIIFLLL